MAVIAPWAHLSNQPLHRKNSTALLGRLCALTVFAVVLISTAANPTASAQELTPQPSQLSDEDVGLGIRPGAAADAAPTHSVARRWNEVLLESIRRDLARPTVHARNLFHASAAMFDIWSIFDQTSAGYFFGNPLVPEPCVVSPGERARYRALDDHEAAVAEAISYFMAHFLTDRFKNSPASYPASTLTLDTMRELGFPDDPAALANTDITAGDPAALGNHLANCVERYGEVDGSNQAGDYRSQAYEPVNNAMWPDQPATELMANPDRWQPLNFSVFIDQSGNVQETPSFVGAEWGAVVPFALGEDDRSLRIREGNEYAVYLDPGEPVYLTSELTRADYQWGHSLVARWAAHLDHTDGVLVDISPGAIGDSAELPAQYSIDRYSEFFDRPDGGTASAGHVANPHTGLPYPPNIVARGDYTRVLAEFWADGPDSETPPGHWFTILNELVSDHPDTTRQFMSTGAIRSDLEWDILAYFTLGAAMHDSAIAAWSVKGWYDYVRPISAIRHMALLGQSSDPDAANYHPEGLPLEAGSIEPIVATDPLSGADGQHVGKLKIRSWAGAGLEPERSNVGWVRATEWVPYQRPTFVTPPFAGYVSGHSTFSRAAAEVLTAITGDEFFPGGVGEFVAAKNDFLVFEQGPSTDITLQWATYRDASDQTSLSRIWGGIHPPIDDIPGRLMGIRVAERTLAAVEQLLDGERQPATEVNARPRPTAVPLTSEELAELSGFAAKGEPTRWFERRPVRVLLSTLIVFSIALASLAINRRRHSVDETLG